MLFHEDALVTSRFPYIPTHVDHVVNRLLAGYHDLPFYVVPSSHIYDTNDASTYDTLQPMYVHREHAMSLQRLSQQCGHPAFPSYTELRTNMLFKQIPQPAPELQTWPIDRNYLQFELSPTMSVLETAEFQRMNGPIHNLLTLYTHHNGPLPCLQTNSDVRSAIINELRRDHIRHNYVGTIDVSSNDRFKPREFRCLLQALLIGTLLPTQYSGRMLPYSLINFLRTHVDDATQTRFNYAYLRLDASQVNVRMFWNIIESDTILAITTAPYTDLQHTPKQLP